MVGGTFGLASTITSASSTGAAGFDLYSALGLGIGGMFVAVVLIVHLGYLDLLKAADIEAHRVDGIRPMLVAVTVPLLLTFAGIVLYHSLMILGYVEPA
jgi:hypothetical protein